jgi:phage gp16-like protein
MTTTVVTETLTETLVGTMEDGTKIVQVWSKQGAANDGGDADTSLVITLTKYITTIRQHWINVATDSTTGLGAITAESHAANAITFTLATGLAANETAYFHGLVFGV